MSTTEIEKAVEELQVTEKAADEEVEVGKLTLEEAKEVIQAILREVNSPEVAERLQTAKDDAAGDLGKIMANIVSVFYEIQGLLMEPYGFEANDEGFKAFAEALKAHEGDEEFAKHANEFKAVVKKYSSYEKVDDAAKGDAAEEVCEEPCPDCDASLTLDEAKQVIQEILKEVTSAEIMERLQAAKDDAAGDMGKIMSNIVPVFYEVQGLLMEPFGFKANDAGFEAFASALKEHEGDAEFSKFSDEFKAVVRKYTSYEAAEGDIATATAE